MDCVGASMIKSVAKVNRMCNKKYHTCYCGKEYDCNYPNWSCSTVNDDEDRNMCDACLVKSSFEQQAYMDEFLEDEEFDDKDTD